MATLGKLEYLISVNNSQLSSGLSKADNQVKGFGNKMSSWAVAKGQVLGRFIETAGRATIGFVKNSVKESMGFDKSMSQVAATLGKSTDEIKQLSKFARKMGAETAFTAQDAAEGLNYMALAGYDAEKSMRMLPTVLNLAAAGTMELGAASDMVTDAQSALGLSIEQTEELVDQMAKTSSKTNTSVSQLGDAILTVGGTAKMMKGETTELSAVLGVLADNGIKGSEGGTALRNVLLSLSAPTDKAAKQLKQLGIEVFDSSGNMKAMPTILEEINDATKDMTQKERTNFLSEVFNKRDLKAIEALLGTDTKRWKELYESIGDAQGAAQKMADTQLDNLAGDVTKFKSAVGESRLAIVERLTPALRKLTKFGTETVQSLTKRFSREGLRGVIDSLGQRFHAFGAMLNGSSNPALHTLGKTLLRVRDAVKIVKLSFTDLPKAMNKAKDLIKKSFGDVSNWLNTKKVNMAKALGISDADNATWVNVAKAAFDKVKNGFKYVAGQAKVGLANLLGLTDENGEAIDDPADTSWSKVAGKMVDKIKDGLKNVGGKSKVKLANLLGLTNENGEAISDPSDTSWSEIGKNMLQRIKDGFKNIGGKSKVKLANLLGLTDEAGNVVDDSSDTSWSAIAEGLKTKLTDGFKTAKVTLASLLGITPENVGDEVDWSDIGKNILGKLTEYFSHKGDFLKKLILGDDFKEESTWTDVGKKISGWLTEAFQEGGLINAILGEGSERIAAIISFAGDLLTGIAGWISNNAGEFTTMLTTLISSLADAISASAGPIIEALGKVFGSPDLWSAVIQGMADIGEALLDAILGKDVTNAIRRFFGVEIPGELSGEARGAIHDAFWETLDMDKNDPQYNQMVAGWSDMMQGIFNASGLDPSLYNDFMDAFSYDKLREKFKNSETQGAFFDQLYSDIENFGGADVKLKPDNTAIIAACEEAYSATVVLNAVKGDGWDGVPEAQDAKGDWNVGFDQVALLHRGETVLTKSQARKYREGETGGSSEIVSAIQGLRNDMANLQLVVGRKVFGKAVVNYGGSRVNDYIGSAESKLAAGYGT